MSQETGVSSLESGIESHKNAGYVQVRRLIYRFAFGASCERETMNRGASAKRKVWSF